MKFVGGPLHNEEASNIYRRMRINGCTCIPFASVNYVLQDWWRKPGDMVQFFGLIGMPIEEVIELATQVLKEE